MQELKRVINYKKLILIAAIALVNIIFFLYANKPVTDEGILSSEKNTHTRYLEEYSDSVNSVIDNADKLKKYSIFTKAGSFSYANILQTADDFRRVADVNVFEDEYKGVKNFTGYYYQYFFSMALMLIVIYDLFAQRDNGMWQLTYGSSKGRVILAIKQTGVIAAASVLVHTIMYWTTFIAAMIQRGGFKDLASPIQNIDTFAKFTYPWSKIQYIMVLYVISLMCIMALALIIWSVFVLFRNRNLAMVVFLIFAAVEQFIYSHIDVHSIWNGLHYINIISIVNINATFSSYRNWGFGTFVFPVFSASMFVLIIITCIMTYIAINVFSVMKPYRSVSLIARLTDRISAVYQKVLFKVPDVVKELHKLIFSNRCVWVIAAMFVVSAYVCASGQYHYTDDNKHMDEEYVLHGGADYTYFQDYLEELQKKYDEVEAQISRYASETYENVDPVMFMNLKQREQQIVKEIKRSREYSDKIEYIGHIEDDYNTNAWFISDRGYEVILGDKGLYRRIMITLAIISGIMIISAGSERIEYKSGMILLERSSAEGRKKIVRDKYIANIILTAALMVAIHGMKLIWMRSIYGMPYLNAPVVSLTFMGNVIENGVGSIRVIKSLILHASIGQFMIVRYMAELVGGLIIMLVMMKIGKSLGKRRYRV